MLKRPDWDDWFMTIAMVVSQRSIDPATKHGCVVIGQDNTILSVGYNNPPRGCDDSQIPTSRPEKYAFFEHAESNAINNAARNGISLLNSTFYISGHPCIECLRRIINVGAKRIIIGPISSVCVDDEMMSKIKMINTSVEIIHLETFNNIFQILSDTSSYLAQKIQNNNGNT